MPPSPVSGVMRYIVLVLTCVAVSLPSLDGQRKSEEDGLEPGSKITETRTGNFDQKLVIDHHKYNGPGETATSRSDDDVNFVYPEDVQLVPKVPISPESPKYALVPVKRLTTATTRTTESASDFDIGFTPTIPSDFEQEIANIRIPHTGLPGFISDPPPSKDEDDEDENEDETEDEDEGDKDDSHFFTNDFLESPEFRDVIKTTKSTPISFSQFRFKNIKPTRTSQPKAVAVTKTITFYGKKKEHDFDDVGERDFDDDEFRQTRDRVKHKLLGPMTPCCNRNIQLQHYSPSQPMMRARPLHAFPVYWGPPKMTGNRGSRVYVRYPRNYSPYRQPMVPGYGRVKVMTQNFVQHPRNRYRSMSPVMMQSTQIRSKKPSSGKKKKKKKSKGECKPKRIIQEIHYHHYDPQLSAQLAPLEGINLKEGDDYEHQVKVITKETEIEDDVKKGHADYDDHNSNLEKEMDKHKAETEQRLARPEVYGDSYNPHYSDSGSTEYIDYNIQTDSSSEIRDPHPAHEYPEDRAFKKGANSSRPQQGGRYVKHRVVKYYYRTPDTRRR